MNIYKIITSRWDEEGFILATQLNDKQIRSVINPMVEEEREGDFIFTNEDYIERLRDAYPKSVILTDVGGIDVITF
jgi:hypothetical protein